MFTKQPPSSPVDHPFDGLVGYPADAIKKVEIIKLGLTFPQYKDWRNYGRLPGEIKALYELIQTGKRSYFD
jgi:hypothetical protein